jgi:cold shock CspA family protein
MGDEAFGRAGAWFNDSCGFGFLRPITATSSYNYTSIKGDGDGEIGYKVLKPGSKGRFTVATFGGD